MVNDGGAVLTWDEENRLTGHSKSLKKTCFFYDAAGERYYKNSGSTMMIVNNGVWQMMTFYENPTLYASPYVVATPDGYTKHYYVESERFASRIGDGTITGLNTHAATASVLAAKQAKVDDAAPDSIMPNSFGYLPTLPFNWSSHHTTYWQHSDHLGSASWVTDTNGAAYQHLQYMPWGEPLLDQRKSGYTYNTRYTFSGKERDEETGYSYFGARYYNSALSIWLSVDPMSDKYPGVSPYTYCGNNPVRLVDPDGRKIAPGNQAGQEAIDNYFGNFSERILRDAFGLVKQQHTDDKNGSYTVYMSSHHEPMKQNEFYRKLGNLSKIEKTEAYAVYTALFDEGLYIVGVWQEELYEDYTIGQKVFQEGTHITDMIEGYASPAVFSNNAYIADLNFIKQNDVSSAFDIAKHNKFQNNRDIFTEDYNYYVNYAPKNKPLQYQNNQSNNIGCLIFNGRENGKQLGNAFLQIILNQVNNGE